MRSRTIPFAAHPHLNIAAGSGLPSQNEEMRTATIVAALALVASTAGFLPARAPSRAAPAMTASAVDPKKKVDVVREIQRGGASTVNPKNREIARRRRRGVMTERRAVRAAPRDPSVAPGPAGERPPSTGDVRRGFAAAVRHGSGDNSAALSAPPPLARDPLLPLVRAAARAADMRKAADVVALRVSALTVVTEFMIVCVGTSRPQNNAIAAAIADELETDHGRSPKREGSADGGWIVLDYGDVLVHVMSPRAREFYDLEVRGRRKREREKKKREREKRSPSLSLSLALARARARVRTRPL